MNKRKGYSGLLLILALVAFLSMGGLAASPGTAGITFVEDDSSLASEETPPRPASPGSPDRNGPTGGRQNNGEDRADTDRPGDSALSASEAGGEPVDNFVSILNPELPLSTLGSLPKTGADTLPTILTVLGCAFFAQAFRLIAQSGGRTGRKKELS